MAGDQRDEDWGHACRLRAGREARKSECGVVTVRANDVATHLNENQVSADQEDQEEERKGGMRIEEEGQRR